MLDLPKINNTRGNIFLSLLIFFLIVGAACYFTYNNADFQKAHRRDIYTAKIKFREYKKSAGDFLNTSQSKIQDFKKSHNLPGNTSPQAKTPTFNELIYNPDILNQEIPADMIRHQPDEITVCFFDAKFLLNNNLSKNEVLHLANIFRFCDLSSISGLNNKIFLNEITNLLRPLHYNAVSTVSPAIGKKTKTFSAYLFRNDRIAALKPTKLIAASSELPLEAFDGQFRAGTFDFTLLTLQTPADGLFLSSVSPLENIYEIVKAENTDVQDIIVLGNFSFQSTALNWDNSGLLPTVAGILKNTGDKSSGDLLGNFWFRKKDVVEFNGNSGIIDIKTESFPSAAKSASTANKPVWAQFKLMPDDDQ